MLTFWRRRRDRRKHGLSDNVVRSRVDVHRAPDADVSRIEKPLTDHVVPTLAAVRLAVGAELAERQSSRRCRLAPNALSDHVVVAVVVVQRALVVGRRLPRSCRYRLQKDVVAESLHAHRTTSLMRW